MSKYIIVIATFLNALFSGSGSAGAGLFAEAGHSRFNKPIEGLWYQSFYPHDLKLDSTYKRIGYEIGGVRLSYFDLGRYGTAALATQDEHGIYNGECDINTCSPPDMYLTEGKIDGLLLSGVFRAKQIFAELGVSYTRQSFKLTTYEVVHQPKWDIYPGRGWCYEETLKGVGYMAAAGVEYQRFTVSASVYYNDKSTNFAGGYWPSGVDTTYTIAVGYRF